MHAAGKIDVLRPARYGVETPVDRFPGESVTGKPRGLALPQIDFRALFETLPSPHMVLDRDLCFVEANLAYQRVTERTRDQLIGGNIFDLFPNPGEGGRRLRASLERVLTTGESDTLALIPYAIPLPVSRGGGFEMRRRGRLCPSEHGGRHRNPAAEGHGLWPAGPGGGPA